MKSPALCVIAALLFAESAHAQLAPAWEGRWEGPCTVVSAERGASSLTMSVEVRPLAGRKGHAWTIVYDSSGAPASDRRPYELVPAEDGNPGHFIMDEKTGLILDHYLVGNTLHAAFHINGRLFNSTYQLVGDDRMVAGGPAYIEQPIRETCYRGRPGLCVKTLAFSSVQDCTLTRVR